MANKKVKMKMTMPGLSGEGSSDGFPSGKWVQRNKNSAIFKKIVEDAWAPYLLSFEADLRKNYKAIANSSLDKKTSTKERYGQSEKYRRAANMTNSQRGHMAVISEESDMNGFASGLYYDAMRVELLFNGTDITILHPMTDSKFLQIIQLIRKGLIPRAEKTQNGNKTLHLSKFLADEDKFNFNPRRWVGLVAAYKEGGAQYNAAMKNMNESLANQERSRKRGSYKKRK